MLALVAALLLSQTPQHRLFLQPNLPTSSLAQFEAFPASGAGTTTACSATAPTGARGEVLTFTRASNGTCTRTATGGLATTGIGDADLSILSSNVARVEYDSNSVLGLLVEAPRTNLLFQFIAIDTAVTWTDVGTPTLTTGQTSPFAGALATGAVQIEDNDGAAFEGRAQSVAVTAASAYFMHCYVKAGTRAEARISIDGTTQDITGLSATTWSIVEKADASASGANIPVQILVGDAVGDTGTVIFGGCQVELGAYRTSIIPTTTIAVARATEAAEFPAVTGLATTGCVAATLTPGFPLSGGPVNIGVLGSGSAVTDFLYARGSTNLWVAYDSTNNPTLAAAWVKGSALRGGNEWTGSTMVLHNWSASTTTSASFDGVYTNTKLQVGGSTQAGIVAPDSIIGRIQADPTPSRCGP